jgi:A/G-specific adenine glycosylase
VKSVKTGGAKGRGERHTVTYVMLRAVTAADKEFATRLLAWFDLHGRKHLPWQGNPETYRVWVSEIMLQQTQVAAVIPYFERFMARFPTLEALATADLDEVLHLWTGLGYYARARNLHATARTLSERHGGEFPSGLKAVMALPGIGRSTAGAILALARGERHAILDGNVKRVLARVFGIAGDPSSAAVLAELWQRAEACTPHTRIGAYTQAIMDLGATVCTRTRPTCTLCPMNGLCVAAHEGRQRELPEPKRRVRARPAREAVLLIAESTGCDNGARTVLVERRPPAGIWGGLWSPPQFDSEAAALAWAARFMAGDRAGDGGSDGGGDGAFDAGVGPFATDAPERLPPIEHSFTHFDLRLRPLRIVCRPLAATLLADGDTRRWYALAAPPRVGLPQPIRALFARLALAPGVRVP